MRVTDGIWQLFGLSVSIKINDGYATGTVFVGTSMGRFYFPHATTDFANVKMLEIGRFPGDISGVRIITSGSAYVSTSDFFLAFLPCLTKSSSSLLG